MNTIKTEITKLKTKRVFLRKGTCSRAFFYILNREFGYPIENEEKAIDPLAGGILQQGYQCGMVWGASMAIGAESLRMIDKQGKAIGLAIIATQHIIDSFVSRTKSIECEEITNCDWSSKKSMAKYFLSGKFVSCYILSGKWAPEALMAAKEGLSADIDEIPSDSISCASELAKKMGASKEEMLMLAGFAGGLGLSGNGCGALAAAIWMNTLSRVKNESYKASMSDPIAEKIINSFYEVTDYEIECSKICGKKFNTLEEHTKFIQNGGCKDLINTIAEVSSV